MATYYGSKVELNANSVNVIEPKMLAAGRVDVVSTITPTAAATNDVWEMLDLPASATITSITLDADSLDSNASKTITLSVLDDAAAHTFISASTVAQAGGVASDPSLTHGSIGYSYAATTRIRILVATGAATFQSGTVRLCISYTMDP